MTDENKFPCSVTAMARIFSAAARSSSSSIRQAPSSSENSVWRCRWTNSAMVDLMIYDRRSLRKSNDKSTVAPSYIVDLHSHSIVDGGFELMSYTTRLMPL